MPRLLPMVLVLALLVASSAAFAVTEGLKLTKSPIVNVHRFAAFSPVCRCTKDTEQISFDSLARDRVDVDILGADQRTVVRTLATGKAVPKGWAPQLEWNGRNDAGAVAGDGTYYVRISFAKAHKAITIPNKIVLDTTPPTVASTSLVHATFSPDHDGQADNVRISARFSESAHLAVWLRGSRILFSKSHRRSDTVSWSGGGLAPGSYRLAVGGVDVAGNVTPAAQRKVVVVRIRYIEPTRSTYRITAGTRFAVGVDTDARSYAWRLGRRHGVASTRQIVLRAPSPAGRYRLVLTENGRSGFGVVIAEPRR